MPPDDGDDPFAGTARNLLLAFACLVCAALLMAHDLFSPREAVVAVAVGVVLLVVVALGYAWAFGPRPATWITLGAAFLASRSMLALATGKVWAVRDALDHIYGVPLAIVRTGHLPDGYVYSAYPTLQLLLAEAHFVTGLPLWECAGLLAPVLGLATMALVARSAETVWPGAGLPAGVGFLVAFTAVSPGQLLQPMTVTILLFAFLIYLVVQGPSLAWAPALFFAGLIALGLSHPYSAVVIGLVLFLALTTEAFLGRSVRFLIPMAVALSIGVAYIAFVGQDLSRFLELLQPNDVSPVPVPDTGTSAPDPSPGSTDSPSSGFSDAYRQVGAWAFRLSMLAALAGFVLAFWPRPLRAVFLQVQVAFFGLTYLAARVISYGFPVRVLTIASAATAPFIGLALHRLHKAAAIPVAAGLAFLAVTAPASTYQFFPFSEGDPAVHALDDPPETADLVGVFFEIQGGELRRSNPVASHPVFNKDDHLLTRAFSSRDVPGTALHTHFIFREGATEYGFAVSTTQAAYRVETFVPYPTQGQLALLDGLDRFGDFGSFHLHRG